jgi:hypothetical protein
MQLFHCAHCHNLVYFENHRCITCGRALAYLPDHRMVASFDGEGDELTTPAAPGQQYRMCVNYTKNHTCNWAVPASSPDELCESCRFTRVIPDLSLPEWRTAWYRLEVAKRRLLYEIGTLGLPLVPKADDEANGLAFEFLADLPATGAAPVLTGHADGVITIALAEADDAERERRRQDLHEPYRTLLGHFRHEIGHYYWDRLIRDGGRLDEFRAVFGDETADYAAALQAHYTAGVPPDWAEHFISAYASAHPWEDWAETWTHYLHMVDSLETAEASGVRVESPLSGSLPADEFDAMLQGWHGLTHTLNNLNRSLGLNDPYPFVLSPPAMAKMRFVHRVIKAAAKAATLPSVTALSA